MEILQFLQSQGMINIDDVQEQMKKQEKEKIIKNHPYKIWQGKNGRWYTHLPDGELPGERRKIVKSTEEKLNNEIIKYYEEQGKKNRVITLRSIYPEWLQSRKHEVNCINTVKKNNWDWEKYYLNDPIIDVPMEEITEQQLKDWAHKKIETYHLNKRAYYNMAVVMKKCFEFAKASRLIEYNTWEDVKINTKKFKREQKKENTTQIYFYDEQQKLIEYSLSLFFRDNRNISALVIPFLFLTGLRAGEVVALRYCDLTENDICVRQSESTVYRLDEEGKFEFAGQTILDHAKTEAGERMIPFTKDAKKIIKMIKEASEEHGFYDEGYIFCPRSSRLKAGTIDKKLYRYCDAVGIPRKSAHKIRKTYISRLINDGRLDIDTICRVAGHTDLKTTFHSYCFGLEERQTIHSKFELILDTEKSVTKCNQKTGKTTKKETAENLEKSTLPA